VDGRVQEAYLANPGRLWELLLPGTELLLSPDLSRGRLPYTVLACRKNDRPVLLHTHLTNKVIAALIENGRLPEFEDYRVDREEPACGNHRFDLLLKHRSSGNEYYLEIKTCTLFAGRVSMFPDAVTKRGAEHLYKLKSLAQKGIKAGCLFVVMNPEAEFFLPAYHIDYNFAGAFKEVKEDVQLSAVAIGFDSGFDEVNLIKPLKIPFNFLNAELQDRGVYLLIARIEKETYFSAGSLGEITLKQGFYVYTGSAKRGLSKRTARHTRKRKQKRWHIDYLVQEAGKVTPIEIISGDELECELAGSLKNIAELELNGFGSSDCRCRSHLFYFAENPLNNPRFIDIIQYYRIERLEGKFEHHLRKG